MTRYTGALLAFAASITGISAAYAQTNVRITFERGVELSEDEEVRVTSLTMCIIEEREGLAKRYLRKDGDERLRLLLPLIAAPCRPEDGSSLNVPSLEMKLRELLDA